MKRQNIIIALGQFAPVWKAVDENIAQMSSMIREAGKACADLIVFPELSRTGYSPQPSADDYAYLAESLPSADSQQLAEVAVPYGMAVAYGTLEKSRKRAYNSVVWLEKNELFCYRKTHIHWTENFTPGEEFPVFDSQFARVGTLVCFDLGFPEAARTLALQGAELIIAPSAVPRNFMDINRRRVVARAMDNQLFVIYCNYTGKAYGGGSLVVNPSGEILYEAGSQPGLYLNIIDLGQVAHWRNYERIYDHRRTDIYKV